MELVSFYHEAGIHYRQELVKCGKKDCGSCPHGRYWYAYTRRGALLKKTYVGKDLPAAVLDHAPDHIRMRLMFQDDADEE
jgi:hypothetical protein